MRRLVAAIALVVLLCVGGLVGVVGPSQHGGRNVAMVGRRVRPVQPLVGAARSPGAGRNVGTLGGNEWGGELEGSTH